jgi:hypothetical protein
MAQYTDITILLDRSASMASIRDTMNNSIDEFALAHRVIPSTRITLIQFDDVNDQEFVYIAKPAKDIPKSDLQPRGNTPLLDALCRAIDNTGKRLSVMPDSERPDQVLFVIITDGEENQSKEYRRKDVKERIDRQTQEYKWQFIYLGANQDAFHEAASFGIGAVNTVPYASNRVGTANVMSASIKKSVDYASNTVGARGQSTALAFTTEERAAALEDDEEV